MTAIEVAADVLTRTREQLAAALVESSNDAIICKALDGRILDWNRGAEQIFGYSAQEMIGQSILRLFPPERIPEETHFLAELIAGRTISHFVTQRIRKDGQTIDVSVTLSSIRDDEGRIVAISKIARDVTETTRLRARLDETTADLQQIIDQAPMMIASWNTSRQTRFANRAFAAHYRSTTERLPGRPMEEVLGPLAYARAQPLIDAAFAGQDICFERQIALSDGTYRWELVDYVPDRRAGELCGINVFTRDITRRKEAEEAARLSAGLYRDLYEYTPAMIHSTDREHRLLSVSHVWVQKLGFQREEVIGRPVWEFFSANSRVRLQEIDMPALLVTGVAESLQLQMVCRGAVLDVLMSAIIELDADGEFRRTLCVVEDVTARNRAERELRTAEREMAARGERLRVTLNSIGDAVITTDSNGQVEWLNPAAARLTGWNLSDACGKDLTQIMPVLGEDSRLPIPLPSRSPSTHTDEHLVLISQDGMERGIQNTSAPITDTDGEIIGYVVVFHDVTEERRAARAMRHQALHDGLTGIANRTAFESRLHGAFYNLRPQDRAHVLLFIDMDQFKTVNDTCGHPGGDRLLREAAALFQSCIRAKDTLARVGGDEFVVLMENCPVAQARGVAERIRDRIEQYRFRHEQHVLRVGASIGLVAVDARWEFPEQAMKAADDACYAAKKQGRNRVHEWLEDVSSKIADH